MESDMKNCPICKESIIVIYGTEDCCDVQHCHIVCPRCKTPLDFQKSEWGEPVSYNIKDVYDPLPLKSFYGYNWYPKPSDDTGFVYPDGQKVMDGDILTSGFIIKWDYVNARFVMGMNPPPFYQALKGYHFDIEKHGKLSRRKIGSIGAWGFPTGESE
jgi:hypothetical protein